MSETYPVPARVTDGSPNGLTTLDAYRRVHRHSTDDPDGFWLDVATERLAWETEPTQGLDGSYHSITDGPLTWFADGTLNVTVSCVDRHAAATPDRIAILWEGDEPGDVRRISYRQLSDAVNQTANALRALGLQKGERAILYMGMVPEAAIAMLACARIGAVHSVVFGGFSAEALRDRIRDCQAEIVITQDQGLRGSRTVPLKAVVDQALEGERGVKKVLVYERTGADLPYEDGRDVRWASFVGEQSTDCAPEIVRCRAPAVHPVHLGLHGPPEGSRAHHGRLPDLCQLHARERSSTCAPTTSTPAWPMSAGSPATATSCTARCATARRP